MFLKKKPIVFGHAVNCECSGCQWHRPHPVPPTLAAKWREEDRLALIFTQGK